MGIYWDASLDEREADRLVREILDAEERRTLINEHEEYPDVYLDVPSASGYEIASGKIVL